MTAHTHPITASSSVQSHLVYAADHLFVSLGANVGDGLGGPDEVCLGDIYRLDREAEPYRLIVLPAHTPGAEDQPATAMPPTPPKVAARYIFMTPQAEVVEVLLICRQGGFLALPLTRLRPRVDYTLVAMHAATPLEEATTPPGRLLPATR